MASLLAYLFPGRDQPAPPADAVAMINAPFRICTAFVPDNATPEFRLPEAERQRMAGVVREAFASYPFVRAPRARPRSKARPPGWVLPNARAARASSFETALRQMIGNLKGAVVDFRERAPRDPGIRLVLPSGYDPGKRPQVRPTACGA